MLGSHGSGNKRKGMQYFGQSDNDFKLCSIFVWHDIVCWCISNGHVDYGALSWVWYGGVMAVFGEMRLEQVVLNWRDWKSRLHPKSILTLFE